MTALLADIIGGHSHTMGSGRVADFALNRVQAVAITRNEDHAGALPRTRKHQVAT